MSLDSGSSMHPFANTTSRLEILPNRIDVEEESRLYDDLVFDATPTEPRPPQRPYSPGGPPSVFSNDIWLGDNMGESAAFAREVKISGWTSVGDALGGAYVVYDCVMKTKEGNLIHAHKRYSDFVALESELLRTLPRSQRTVVPELPPKAPLARYRSAFLARRRHALEHWLSAVLLHPDVGGCEAVRRWVMNRGS
ncbi:Phox homologous domain-containing protein [Mycena maculata]|uniref:Endosomal/vacuolar adapter protein YPT35 n=1 Tax=Mycena maculata TaxID=230809 RepID=A0AAD7IQL9_9AGAR|nr:Phox homologous domain-containing protein [Mycena maculata]